MFEKYTSSIQGKDVDSIENKVSEFCKVLKDNDTEGSKILFLKLPILVQVMFLHYSWEILKTYKKKDGVFLTSFYIVKMFLLTELKNSEIFKPFKKPEWKKVYTEAFNLADISNVKKEKSKPEKEEKIEKIREGLRDMERKIAKDEEDEEEEEEKNFDPKRWTDDEDELLRGLIIHEMKSFKDIGERLGRSVSSIAKRAEKFGLSEEIWAEKEDEKLESLIDKGLTSEQIGKEFGKSAHFITLRALKIGRSIKKEKKPTVRKTVRKSRNKTAKKKPTRNKRTTRKAGKKSYDKEGQKYDTPPSGDALYVFYTSLYEEKPNSNIAVVWLTERGVFEGDERKKLVQKWKKIKNRD